MKLETVSGNFVDIENPDPQTIKINDIAWALSRIPRFAGHTISAIPFTVGEHSIFVANIVKRLISDETFFTNWYKDIFKEFNFIDYPPKNLEIINQYFKSDELIIKALLHDAAEVFSGDIPSPLKHQKELKPILKRIEDNLMEAIYIATNITPPSKFETCIIKFADKIAQKIEAHTFMTSRGKDWPNLPEVSIIDLQNISTPKTAIESYSSFLEMFNEYKLKLNNE